MNNLQQYSDLAETWWQDSGPFQDLLHLNPPRFAFFDTFVADWNHKRVLDLGCGGGFVSEELARRGAQVMGVDPAAPLLNVARRHASQNSLNIDYREGSGEQVPAADSHFDIVVCVDVLEHVNNLDSVLREVHRVLKPGGLFLYDTINRNVFSFLWMIVALEWVSGRIPRGTHDWRKFIRPAEIRDRLQSCGFESLEQAGITINGLKFSKFDLQPTFKVGKRMTGVYVGAARRH